MPRETKSHKKPYMHLFKMVNVCSLLIIYMYIKKTKAESTGRYKASWMLEKRRKKPAKTYKNQVNYRRICDESKEPNN